jgi:VWFA-related protein
MRNRTSLLLCSALALSIPSATLSAQNPQPAPPATVRVYTREVIVDINVTDAKGDPVHGLTRNDFTVLEDNVPMVPRSFREHRSDDTDPAPTAVSAALPPNTFTNVNIAENRHPLTILLIDSLDTPVATQSIVQKRMLEFAEKVGPGNRMAVFSLSSTGQLSLVQGFTSDSEPLRKAIKSHAFGIGVPSLEDSGQDSNVDMPADMQQTPVTTRKQQPLKSMQPQQVKVDPELECSHAAARGQYTVAALDQIARYVSGMPGRKNLVWLSGAFPQTMRNKNGICYDLSEDMHEAANLLDHSHVSVFPIDPRALDLQAKNDAASRPVRQQASENRLMENIAESTGGKAFYTTNDLAAAALQAMDLGGNYYTFTYAPPNPNNDTRLRTISVQVDQPNLTLLYKRGYHSVPPNTMVSTGKPMDRATPMQSAMMRGALQPTQVLFHVSATAAPATSLLVGASADPKAMRPPYRRLTLTYLIDLSTLQFDAGTDGTYRGQFEYAVSVYDPRDGRLLNSSALVAKPALPAAVYQSMLQTGAKLRQEIDVPANGDYTLRIGVHDLATDRVGAIEVSTADIRP